MKLYKCPWCEGTCIGEQNDNSDKPPCEVCDGDGKVHFNPKNNKEKEE